VVNTYFTEIVFTGEYFEEHGIKNVPLYYLAMSINEMIKVDTVYFLRGWSKARGCQTEHFAAKTYGLNVLYEE
jgi:hypothetical protein